MGCDKAFSVERANADVSKMVSMRFMVVLGGWWKG